jgi:hypothetical protein
MLLVVESRKPLDQLAEDLAYGAPGLATVAREVEATLEAIMAEAAA